MTTKRLPAAFAIALVVSLLCTWVVSRKMKAAPVGHVAELHYIAAKRTLLPGEILKPELIEVALWPADHEVSGTFLKAEDVIGRSVLYPIEQGQPITDKLVSALGTGAGLAGEIPNGMRAIALRSDEVMGVAGFLLPGSHLDVLVTYRTDKSPEPITMTVLQNAEVLAAGQKTQPDPEGKPATATVVTLLLTPADAQKAVLASTQGTIHFVLRSGSDKAIVVEPPIELAQLYPGSALTNSEPKQPKPAPVPIARDTNKLTIETITGDKESSTAVSGAK